MTNIYELMEQRTVISQDGMQKTYNPLFTTRAAASFDDAIKAFGVVGVFEACDDGMEYRQRYDMSDGSAVEWYMHIRRV